jgi:hypothetical protein
MTSEFLAFILLLAVYLAINVLFISLIFDEDQGCMMNVILALAKWVMGTYEQADAGWQGNLLWAFRVVVRVLIVLCIYAVFRDAFLAGVSLIVTGFWIKSNP